VTFPAIGTDVLVGVGDVGGLVGSAPIVLVPATVGTLLYNPSWAGPGSAFQSRGTLTIPYSVQYWRGNASQNTWFPA